MIRDIKKVFLSLSVVERHCRMSCHGGLNYTYLTMRAFSSIQGRDMLTYIQKKLSPFTQKAAGKLFEVGSHVADRGEVSTSHVLKKKKVLRMLSK
jgi:hypothetical protein